MKALIKLSFTLLLVSLVSLSLAFEGQGVNIRLQDLAPLQKIGYDYLNKELTVADDERLEIEVEPLDQRLQLAYCTEEPEAFLPKGNKPNNISSVGIACKGQKSWKIFVPAKVKVLTEVAVAVNTIPRLENILSYEVKFIEKDKKPLRSGYYKSEIQLHGMVAKNTIPAGAIITKNMVQPEKLVKRGDNVIIVAGNESILIETTGVAKASGSMQERIEVFNSSSKRVIEAVVVGPGKVRV